MSLSTKSYFWEVLEILDSTEASFDSQPLPAMNLANTHLKLYLSLRNMP